MNLLCSTLSVPAVARALCAGLVLALSACSTIDSKVTNTDSDGDGVPDVRDCAPDDPDIHPGRDEVCDGEDQDCDGEIDEGAIDAEEEVCDGIDNDCDGEIDEGLAVTWYPDADGDGFGDPALPVTDCNPGSGLVDNADDCDDTDDAIHPDATEICDGIDNNCRDGIDEGLGTTFYADSDGDGYGDLDAPASLCEPEEGYSEDASDCDDRDPTVFPGALEQCNDDIDQDCDGRDELCWIYGDLILEPDADITLGLLDGGSQTGSCLDFVGDYDGNGAPDLLVGSMGWDGAIVGLTNSGAGHIVSIDPTFRRGLVDLDTTGGIGHTVSELTGTDLDAYHGRVCAGVGDLDGDGLEDIAIGSEVSDDRWLNGGMLYVVRGSTLATGGLSLEDADASIVAGYRDWRVGASVVGAGDLNGDGFDDLVVGSAGTVNGAPRGGGAVHLFLGCKDGLGQCTDPDGDGDYDVTLPWSGAVSSANGDQELLSVAANERLGAAVTAGFDFNADGMPDMFLGAPGAASGAGEAYLVLDFPFSTTTASGQASHIITGRATTDGVGDVLLAPGDLDRDGYDDVVVGVPEENSETGAMYVFTGKSNVELSGVARELSVSDADYAFVGLAAGERFGAALTAGGDIDGDGIAELLVGAPGADFDGVSRAGEVRVLRGPLAADMADEPLARISGVDEDGAVGSTIESGVDIDGDGWAEIIVGAPGFDSEAGAAFVLFGGYIP